MEIKDNLDPRLGRTHVTLAWLRARGACTSNCTDIEDTFDLRNPYQAIEINAENLEMAFKASVEITWVFWKIIPDVKAAEEINRIISRMEEKIAEGDEEYKGEHGYDAAMDFSSDAYIEAISKAAGAWASRLAKDPECCPPPQAWNIS